MKNIKKIFINVIKQKLFLFIIVLIFGLVFGKVFNLIYSDIEKRFINSAGEMHELNKYFIICLILIGFKLLNVYILNFGGGKFKLYVEKLLKITYTENIPLLNKHLSSGEYVKFHNSNSGLSNLLEVYLNIILSVVTIILTSLYIIYFASYKFLIFLIALIPFFGFIKNKTNQLSSSVGEVIKSESEVYSLFTELYDNINVIKSFNLQKAMDNRFNNFSYELIKNQMKVEKINIKIYLLQQFLGGIAYLGIPVFGCWLYHNEGISVGVIFIANSLFFKLLDDIGCIVGSIQTLSSMKYNEKNVEQTLDARNNNINVLTKKVDANSNNLISLDNIIFSYKKEHFIKNLTLNIEPNTFTAIVGPSGCGKSTLLKLIANIEKPQKGKIIFKGQLIDRLLVQQNFSYIEQNSYLFPVSVIENISYAYEEKQNIKSIKEKVKMLGMEERINKLDKGYDTIIDENSKNVSGGQKQIISVLRGVLKNSEVILLDEPTASLDKNLSKDIINSILKYKNQRTIVIVTHDLKIASLADNIIVMDEGKVIDSGKHNQLIKQCDFYNNFVKEIM